MSKKQERFLVLEHRYCGDGVSASFAIFKGTKLQCDRLLFNNHQYEYPLRIVPTSYYDEEIDI